MHQYINFAYKLYVGVVQSTVGEDSEPFTQPEIVRIGKRIPDKWEVIALTTGKFEDYEIKIIKLDQNYNNEAQKARKMLNDYKCRLGSRKDLVSALRENDMDKVANINVCSVSGNNLLYFLVIF